MAPRSLGRARRPSQAVQPFPRFSISIDGGAQPDLPRRSLHRSEFLEFSLPRRAVRQAARGAHREAAATLDDHPQRRTRTHEAPVELRLRPHRKCSGAPHEAQRVATHRMRIEQAHRDRNSGVLSRDALFQRTNERTRAASRVIADMQQSRSASELSLSSMAPSAVLCPPAADDR